MWESEPRVTPAIGSAALPAAGAYTSSNEVDVPKGARRITYWVKYTKAVAAVTGGPSFRHEWQTQAGGQVYNEPINNPALVAPAEPFASQKHYLGQWNGPVFDATISEGAWPITFEVPAGAYSSHLRVAETVDPANPGTFEAAVGFSGVL